MSFVRPVTGKVALVTGGASGLGLGAVKRLVKQGAKVTIVDLPKSKGDEVVREFKDNAIFAPADVTKEADINNALNATKSKFGRLDAVVNCAGLAFALKTYDFQRKQPHGLKEFEKIINVNLVGAFNVIRLAVALIGENSPDADGQRGVIINTASIAAFDGQKGQIAYSASKGGIVGMTLPLARDLSSQGIRCCTIAPGLFETPIMSQIPDKAIQFLISLPQMPKRLGNVDEFAHLVQFIIENPMVNGDTIRLDGGVRMP